MFAPLLSAVVALCCVGDSPDRPPPLTFDKHVDYIAWCNDVLKRGKTKNALPLYKGLCPDASGNGGFRGPEGAAKKQADQIATDLHTWEAKDYPALASYLQTCAPQLETLKKATRLRYYWQPISPDTKPLLAHVLTSLSPRRHACVMTIVRAWMNGKNQAKALMAAHRIVLRAADHTQQDGMVICGLVGMAERGLVYKSVLAGLGEGIIAGKEIKRTYKALRKYDPGTPDWKVMLDFEWACLLDALQLSAGPDGKLSAGGWKMLTGMMGTALPQEDAAAFLKTDARETCALIEQHFEQMRHLVDGATGAKTLDRIRKLEDEESPKIKKNVFTRIMASNFSRGYEITVRSEAERRGTMLTLAIHAHHDKHGQWPESLKKIDKKLGLKGLKTIRRDPFSGKSFKYRINGGKPLLYSIGADGKDDGGRHDPKWGSGKGGGDFVFWPRPPRRP